MTFRKIGSIPARAVTTILKLVLTLRSTTVCWSRGRKWKYTTTTTTTYS